MDNHQIQEVINDIFDACVNPLANMMNSFLVMQVRKGFLTKEEALLVIASSVSVLKEADITQNAREMGADTLMRMLKALEAQTSN
jgi:hypothetical protein